MTAWRVTVRFATGDVRGTLAGPDVLAELVLAGIALAAQEHHGVVLISPADPPAPSEVATA